MNDVNAHTEGFSDGVNGRCTASGCVGPQRSPTLHIYDPPWDALGYNASVARAVAAVYGEVMVAPAAGRALRRALDRAGAAGARQPKPGQTKLMCLT